MVSSSGTLIMSLKKLKLLVVAVRLIWVSATSTCIWCTIRLVSLNEIHSSFGRNYRMANMSIRKLFLYVLFCKLNYWFGFIGMWTTWTLGMPWNSWSTPVSFAVLEFQISTVSRLLGFWRIVELGRSTTKYECIFVILFGAHFIVWFLQFQSSRFHHKTTIANWCNSATIGTSLSPPTVHWVDPFRPRRSRHSCTEKSWLKLPKSIRSHRRRLHFDIW